MIKAAPDGLVKGQARDLGPRGTWINKVQPDPLGAAMNPVYSDFANNLKEHAPAVQGYGTGDEIASLVASLTGPAAGFVTGAGLAIGGGFAA